MEGFFECSFLFRKLLVENWSSRILWHRFLLKDLLVEDFSLFSSEFFG